MIGEINHIADLWWGWMGPMLWQVYAFGVWLAGMAIVVSLLVTRMKRLRQWHREQEDKRTIPPWFLDLLVATSKRLKLERLPAIVFSDEVSSPAVYGVFHPVVLDGDLSADRHRRGPLRTLVATSPRAEILG